MMANMTIHNPGTIPAWPKLTLYGSGTITLITYSGAVELSGIGNGIILDWEAQECIPRIGILIPLFSNTVFDSKSKSDTLLVPSVLLRSSALAVKYETLPVITSEKSTTRQSAAKRFLIGLVLLILFFHMY